MRDAASVRSFTALEEFRSAVADFRRRAGAAIGEATTEMQRTRHWLESERPMYWRAEVRRRNERLQQARAELSRVLLGSGGESSAREQRSIVAKMQAAAEEAARKLDACGRWAREMDRHSVMLRGGLAPLAQSIDAALPRAEAQIVELLLRLEAYAKTTPNPPRVQPERDDAPSSSSDDGGDSSSPGAEGSAP